MVGHKRASLVAQWERIHLLMKEMQETRVRSLGQEDSPGEGNGNPLQCSYHGQRSLAGCSPWGRKELDTTEATETPLDCKEIQPVHPEGEQSWVFIGRTGVEAETPIFWPPDGKSRLIGKDPDAGRDWGQEVKGMTEDEMAGWHHQLNGHGLAWTLGVGDGQGGLACCGSWHRRVGHDRATELN